MKLNKEQVSSMSNIIYKKVINSPEWQEKIIKAEKKAKEIVDMLKETNQYKIIRSAIMSPCIENMCIYPYKITPEIKGFEYKSKYPILIEAENMDKNIYDYIFESLKPEFISTYDIEDRVMVDSIQPRKKETVDELIHRIAKSFLTSNDSN